MSYAHTMYDNGFIIDELCYIISSMTFIMTPSFPLWMTGQVETNVCILHKLNSFLQFQLGCYQSRVWLKG